MIGYTTIGVSDMAQAEAFYGALLGELGATQLFSQIASSFMAPAWTVRCWRSAYLTMSRLRTPVTAI